MNGFEDLPLRWRTLLTTPDEALAQDTVPVPKRPLKTQDPLPRNMRFILSDHLIILQRELAGLPQVVLAHAALVVLIRRETALEAALDRYFALWDRHEAVLLASLSLRWLVSAADTFADHGRSAAERATGLATALFANTIKLYETERVFSLNLDPTEADYRAQTPQFDLGGMVPFNVQRGDTVGNMFDRKDRVIAGLGVSGRVLDEVTTRCANLETVYSRFRKLHVSKGHKW